MLRCSSSAINSQCSVDVFTLVSLDCLLESHISIFYFLHITQDIIKYFQCLAFVS